MNGHLINTMKYTILTLFFLGLFSISIFSSQPAYAESAIDRSADKLNTIGIRTGFGIIKSDEDLGIYEKIALVINIFLGFAGIIAVILVIFAGFKWMTAQGNEEQIIQAKGTIKSAVIGLGIVLLAFVIVNFVTESLIDIVQNRSSSP